MLTLAKTKHSSWFHSMGWAMDVRLSVDSTTFLLFSLQSTTKNLEKSTSKFKSSNLHYQKVSLLCPKNDLHFHFGYFRGCHRVFYHSEMHKVHWWSFHNSKCSHSSDYWLLSTDLHGWLSLHQLFVNNNSLILRSIPMPLMSWIDNSSSRLNFKHSW